MPDQSNSPRSGAETLTEAEVEILKLVAQGFGNREVANRLGFSELTVRRYMSNILAKLQLENRTQAALYALRAGLASL
jgi:DNA-binding NarL/FixJ family response regulator